MANDAATAFRAYRLQLIEARHEMKLDARQEHLAPAIGALTCAITYLADIAESAERDARRENFSDRVVAEAVDAAPPFPVGD